MESRGIQTIMGSTSMIHTNMKNKSVGADRIERWRKKERNNAISDNR